MFCWYFQHIAVYCCSNMKWNNILASYCRCVWSCSTCYWFYLLLYIFNKHIVMISSTSSDNQSVRVHILYYSTTCVCTYMYVHILYCITQSVCTYCIISHGMYLPVCLCISTHSCLTTGERLEQIEALRERWEMPGARCLHPGTSRVHRS